MFLVFIIARSVHEQVTKFIQSGKAYNYYCSENTHIVTNTLLKEGYVMGCNLLKHALLSLYNHFDTREAQHHDMIFNHCVDILPYRYVSQIPTLCLCHLCTRTCVRMSVCGS